MINEYYGAPTTKMDDFLAHYGVLGMKWGIRRAAKKGQEYSYKSHATKKYEKAAAKLLKKGKTEKAAIMANRAKRSKEVDRGEEEYTRGLSTGQALGLAALAGTANMKAYAQHRAMSKQKGKKLTGEKLMSGAETAFTGLPGSRMRKAGYIRQDEKRKTLGSKAHRSLNTIRKRASNSINRNLNSVRK